MAGVRRCLGTVDCQRPGESSTLLRLRRCPQMKCGRLPGDIRIELSRVLMVAIGTDMWVGDCWKASDPMTMGGRLIDSGSDRS